MKFLNDREDVASTVVALVATVVLFGLIAPNLRIAPPPTPPEPVQTVDISLEAAPPQAASAPEPVPTPPEPQPPQPVQPETPPPPPPPPPMETPVPPVEPPPPPPTPVVEPPKPLPPPPKPVPPKPVAPRPAAVNKGPATEGPAIPSTAPQSPPSNLPAAPVASAASGAEDSYVGALRAYYKSISKYPNSKEARTMKPHGSVVVRFTVTRTGEVRDVSVERPAPTMVLNQQALSTVRGGTPPPLPNGAWSGASEHVFTVTLDYEPPS